MSSALLILRAQTALHPGAGTAIGPIDLPIQRERFTLWPNMQGTGVKGVLRDAYRTHLLTLDTPASAALKVQWTAERKRPRPAGDNASIPTMRDLANRHADVAALFGPDSPQSSEEEHAGALSISDAMILAFPVRSGCGVFAWATCRAVLERLKRLGTKVAGLNLPLDLPPDLSASQALTTDAGWDLLKVGNKLVLEDFVLDRVAGPAHPAVACFGTWLQARIGADLVPSQRVVILSDDAFTYLTRFATELTTRIRLDYNTKRVVDGALFSQEFLPAETLLYSLIQATDARSNTQDSADAVLTKLDDAVSGKSLQFGGEETTGKGWCSVALYRGDK